MFRLDESSDQEESNLIIDTQDLGTKKKSAFNITLLNKKRCFAIKHKVWSSKFLFFIFDNVYLSHFFINLSYQGHFCVP